MTQGLLFGAKATIENLIKKGAMPDPRFFTVAGPFTLQKLAAIAGAEIGPGTDPDAVFTDVAPLDAAGPTDVSFLDNKKYVGAFETSRAGACLVHPDLASRLRAWRCW